MVGKPSNCTPGGQWPDGNFRLSSGRRLVCALRLNVRSDAFPTGFEWVCGHECTGSGSTTRMGATVLYWIELSGLLVGIINFGEQDGTEAGVLRLRLMFAGRMRIGSM